MKYDYLRNIVHSHVLRNTGKLFTANVFAQVLALLVYPLLTRLFSEADFGLLNLFLSIAGVIVICSTAEWQNALPLPKDVRKAAGVGQAALVMVIVVTLLCTIALPFSDLIASLFKASELSRYLWLMPVYVLALGVWTVLGGWLLRLKRFSLISAYQISQSVLSAALKWFFGLVTLTGGLIYGSVIAPLVALLIIFLVWRFKYKEMPPHVSMQEMQTSAAEYKNFPLYAQPRALINTLSGNLPVLLLTPAFGLSAVGLFGMALTLALRPLTMVANSVYQVLFQRLAAKVSERKKISDDIRRFLIIAFAVTLPCFAALYFVLPSLTAWLLGSEWRETGVLIRLMLPWLVMVFAGGCLAFLPDIFAKQCVSLIIECVYIVLRVAALFVGIFFRDFHLAVLLFSLIGTFVIAAQLIWYAALVRRYEERYCS